MVVRYRERKVDGGQQHKHVRLHDRHTEMQREEHQGNANRNQRKERNGQQIACKHIGEQSHGKRKTGAARSTTQGLGIA